MGWGGLLHLMCRSHLQNGPPQLNDMLANSIAFGSAPRREVDSQPISQLVKQAVSQSGRRADRNTQFGFFQ